MSTAIVHVVSGLGRSQGGPSYSVPRLCRAEREAGADVQLCAVETVGDDAFANAHASLFKHDFAGIPVIGRLRASRSLRSHLESVVPSAAAVHVHGLWLMPNVDAGVVARRTDTPLIVSPRGMLAPEALSISRTRKRIFWEMLQRPAYARTALWHATCEAEADEIRKFGVRAPIAVIPNGVDPPTSRPDMPRSNTFLYLGRVHPKKNLPALVSAWAHASGNAPAWRLRIVGPDENGHAAELRAMAVRMGVERLSIEGAVFGAAKAAALADASVFVLPTLNENFGIAVAEALGAGMPAIVTKGAPWAGLEREQCGWWVDHGVAPLADALRIATRKTSDELTQMGERGRAWVTRDFGWRRIAKDMLTVYDWLIRGGAAPSTVRLSP